VNCTVQRHAQISGRHSPGKGLSETLDLEERAFCLLNARGGNDVKKPLLLFAFTCLFLGFNAHAIQITQHMTGSWYNPDQDGHGLNIEVIKENKSVFYWYVYNPDGTPTWLVGRGPHVDGRIEGVAYHNTGGIWGEFDMSGRIQERWGTVTIEFNGCNSALVTYQSDDQSVQTIPYGSGSFEIVKLTAVHKSKCQDPPYAGIYRGYIWSDVAEQGTPATVLLNTHGDVIAFSMGYKTFFGTYTVSDGVFSSQLQAYVNDTRQYHHPEFSTTFEGQVKEEYRLFMEYIVPETDAGFFDTYPVTQLYFRGVTTSELAGDYEIEDMHTFDAGTASIAADGTLTGTDDAGCSWTGDIQIGDQNFNLFQINLAVTGCGDDRNYWGMGFQDDAENLEDGLAIWIFTYDGEKTLSATLTRVTP
jgi:hypothetical protein